jgi:hypothetical protein
VLRVRVGLHPTPALCQDQSAKPEIGYWAGVPHLRWNPRGTEQPRVLVHVEGNIPDGVRLQYAGSEVVYESERGDNQGGCSL